MSDDFATSSVTSDRRRPLYELMLNMAGGPICVAALYAGAALAEGLTLWQAVVAVLCGGAVLVVYGATIGSIGSRTGLSTGMLIRHTFGATGGKVVSALIALCLVGWYAVQTGFFGDTLHAMFPNGGVITSPAVASVWGGLLMLSTAVFGYRGLSILSLFAVPLLVVLCGWGIWAATASVEPAGFVPRSPKEIGFGVSLVVGALAVGATATSDITRYAKSSLHTWIVCIVGYLVANTFMMIGGLLTTVATGSADLMTAMLALGLGMPALGILILGQWTTNDDNLYSSSLALTGAAPSWRKSWVVIACGVVATAFAAFGIASQFVPFLLMLGVGIPPVGGILIADHLRKRSKEPRPERSVNTRAFIAWGLGIAAGLLLPVGLAPVNAIVVSGLAFAAFDRQRT